MCLVYLCIFIYSRAWGGTLPHRREPCQPSVERWGSAPTPRTRVIVIAEVFVTPAPELAITGPRTPDLHRRATHRVCGVDRTFGQVQVTPYVYGTVRVQMECSDHIGGFRAFGSDPPPMPPPRPVEAAQFDDSAQLPAVVHSSLSLAATPAAQLVAFGCSNGVPEPRDEVDLEELDEDGEAREEERKCGHHPTALTWRCAEGELERPRGVRDQVARNGEPRGADKIRHCGSDEEALDGVAIGAAQKGRTQIENRALAAAVESEVRKRRGRPAQGNSQVAEEDAPARLEV
jgi:hypothetical protein